MLELIKAIINGDLARVQNIINSGLVGVNDQVTEKSIAAGDSANFCMDCKGDLCSAEGHNNNILDLIKDMPIFVFAVCRGELEIVSWMAENGANINQGFKIDSGFPSPLFTAMFNGNSAMLMLLVKLGADVTSVFTLSSKKQKIKITPMIFAAELGDITSMMTFIEAGADCSARISNNGDTPCDALEAAIACNQSAVVKFLLSNDEYINSISNQAAVDMIKHIRAMKAGSDDLTETEIHSMRRMVRYLKNMMTHSKRGHEIREFYANEVEDDVRWVHEDGRNYLAVQLTDKVSAILSAFLYKHGYSVRGIEIDGEKYVSFSKTTAMHLQNIIQDNRKHYYIFINIYKLAMTLFAQLQSAYKFNKNSIKFVLNNETKKVIAPLFKYLGLANDPDIFGYEMHVDKLIEQSLASEVYYVNLQHVMTTLMAADVKANKLNDELSAYIAKLVCVPQIGENPEVHWEIRDHQKYLILPAGRMGVEAFGLFLELNDMAISIDPEGQYEIHIDEIRAARDRIAADKECWTKFASNIFSFHFRVVSELAALDCKYIDSMLSMGDTGNNHLEHLVRNILESRLDIFTNSNDSKISISLEAISNLSSAAINEIITDIKNVNTLYVLEKVAMQKFISNLAPYVQAESCHYQSGELHIQMNVRSAALMQPIITLLEFDVINDDVYAISLEDIFTQHAANNEDIFKLIKSNEAKLVDFVTLIRKHGASKVFYHQNGLVFKCVNPKIKNVIHALFACDVHDQAITVAYDAIFKLTSLEMQTLNISAKALDSLPDAVVEPVTVANAPKASVKIKSQALPKQAIAEAPLPEPRRIKEKLPKEKSGKPQHRQGIRYKSKSNKVKAIEKIEALQPTAANSVKNKKNNSSGLFNARKLTLKGEPLAPSVSPEVRIKIQEVINRQDNLIPVPAVNSLESKLSQYAPGFFPSPVETDIVKKITNIFNRLCSYVTQGEISVMALEMLLITGELPNLSLPQSHNENVIAYSHHYLLLVKLVTNQVTRDALRVIGMEACLNDLYKLQSLLPASHPFSAEIMEFIQDYCKPAEIQIEDIDPSRIFGIAAVGAAFWNYSPLNSDQLLSKHMEL